MKKIFMKIILLSFMMTCLVFALRVDAGTRSICRCDQINKKAILYRNRKYDYHIVNNEVHLNAIKKVKKVVRIPSKIKGKKVVAIEDSPNIGSVFEKVNKQRYIVQEVIIPNTVKKICENAFAESEMSAENRVMIEDVVFKKGSKLKQINMDAFSDCHLLNNFEFPKSLRYIGSGAFFNAGLEGKLVLPKKIKEIGRSAFVCTKITEVKIPSKLTKLERQLFYRCKNLEKVTLHDNITEIGTRAFKKCKSLSEIKLPKELKKVSLDAFNGTGVKSLELGKNVKEFEDLKYDIAEYKVTINEKNPYFKIVDGALYNKKMTKLYKVLDVNNKGRFVLPETVEKIKKTAFYGVAYTEYCLGDNIEELPDYLFSKTNVKIYIGKKVKNIKDLNLKYCKNSEYVISEENPYFKTVDGVLFNKDMTELLGFPHTTKKTSYTVPEGVKTIGEKAFNFEYKTTIEEIKLNSDLETIKSGEEKNFNITNKYEQLIHVYAGENLKEIGLVNNRNTYWHVKKGSYAEECMKEYGVEYETYV